MKVEISNYALRKAKKLPKDVQQKLKSLVKKLENSKNTNGIRSSKLIGTKDRYKIRVGDYRVVYQRLSSTHIEITSISDRKKAYKDFFSALLSKNI